MAGLATVLNRSDNVIKRLDDGSKLAIDERQYPEAVDLAKRYPIATRNWYRRRARNVRWWFRLSGFGVIVFAGALPIVAAIDFNDSALVITILSVAVAGLTALRTFFRWDDQWRLLKSADWKLTAVIAVWEASVCALDPNAPNSRSTAIKRTQALLVESKKIIDDEAKAFFLGITWPQAHLAAQEAEAKMNARQNNGPVAGAPAGTAPP